MANQMKIIGLTGQTGGGKSTVAKILAGQGYAVVDADQVSRQVVQKGNRCLTELALEFGVEILQADGTLNRRKLGSIVFPDPEKRLKLNRITFPYITEEILNQLEFNRARGKPMAFIDAAVLFESGWDKHCDLIVSVISDSKLRLGRIMERDQLSRQEAEDRVNAQHGDDYYTTRSDYVITNNADLADLRIQVLETLEQLRKAGREPRA